MSRAVRPTGCRICGARDHHTRCHVGRLAGPTVRRVGDTVKRRLGLDPLGIAQSSWLVNEIVPRLERRKARA
jgi:hypothetical protein